MQSKVCNKPLIKNDTDKLILLNRSIQYFTSSVYHGHFRSSQNGFDNKQWMEKWQSASVKTNWEGVGHIQPPPGTLKKNTTWSLMYKEMVVCDLWFYRAGVPEHRIVKPWQIVSVVDPSNKSRTMETKQWKKSLGPWMFKYNSAKGTLNRTAGMWSAASLETEPETGKCFMMRSACFSAWNLNINGLITETGVLGASRASRQNISTGKVGGSQAFCRNQVKL